MTRISLPPYPNGWFKVCWSDELPKGGVKAVSWLGRDFVVYRGEDGVARVMDAYCVHLGAHLGKGGTVVGNGIRCPFHGWCWDGDTGRCTEVPYAKKIPPKATMQTWTTREQNGFVIIWHHAAGAPPDWTPPIVPEVDDPHYRLHGRRRWELTAHPQELYENGFDVAHFNTLHGMKVQGVEWDPRGPVCSLHLNFERDSVQASAEGMATIRSFMWGPGLSLTRVSGLLEGVSVQSLTPIAPELMELTHNYYVHRDSDPRAVEAFFDYYAKDWELDMPLWNTKVFRPEPVLAEGDGDIARFRRWYRQFYSVDVPVNFETPRAEA